MKIKYSLPEFDDYIGEYTAILEGLDLSGLVEMSMSNEAIGLSMIQDENGTKIKFVMDEDAQAFAKGEIVLVFDANYNLTSMKYDVTVGETVMVMTYKPYNGGINLPGDLDSYQYMPY